jgi:hypothetical protein
MGVGGWNAKDMGGSTSTGEMEGEQEDLNLWQKRCAECMGWISHVDGLEDKRGGREKRECRKVGGDCAGDT